MNALATRIALSVAVVVLTACGAPSPDGPSVLLVTIDTLRADRVGAYGAVRAETPQLDALAREGVLFENAFAVAPITLPSHASMLTGLLPPRHGVRHNGLYRLGEEHVTLAERFQEAGYATAAVVGATVLERRHGLDQGFDRYDDASVRAAAPSGFPERPASDVTDEALAWLAEHGDEPFFLWVHYYDPHASYAPPEPFASRFRGFPYEGEIAYVDAELGRILDELRARHRLEETVVAVTSDHGEAFGEHGAVMHSYTLYREEIRVPLLLRGPDLPSQRRVPEVVSSVDLAPTLLAAAGLEALPEPDGVPLQALLAGSGPAEPRIAYSETLATKLDHGWAPLFALRDATHLFVDAPRPELYDRIEDPAEQHNLLEAPEPGAQLVAERRRARLERILSRSTEGERVALTAADRRQLEALGYLVSEQPAPETGLDPKDGLPLFRQFLDVQRLYYTGNSRAAVEQGEALLEAMPESGRLLYVLAQAHLAEGDAERARDRAEAAAERMETSPEVLTVLGQTRLVAGDLDAALEAFARAVEIDPGIAAAHLGLMARLRQGASVEEVARHARAAVDVDPADADVRLRVATVWDDLGRYDRALAAYEELLAREPDHPEARLGAAIQLVRFERDAEARRRLEEVDVAAHPRLALELAVAWAGRGRRAEAEAVLRALVARHPDLEAASRGLAFLQRDVPPPGS